MNQTLKSILLALAAGVAGFLVVGVAVTEIALEWIEFSLLVGIPAGLASGLFVTVIVFMWLVEETSPQRKRIATALGVFGVTFLVVLVSSAAVLEIGVVNSIITGVLVGIVASGVAYLRIE